MNTFGKLNKIVAFPKVIYSDVDGTILGPRGGIFNSPYGGFTLDTAQSLISLLELGTDIVLVSGRNGQQLRENCRMLSLSNFIPELGSEIVYGLGEKVVPVVGVPRSAVKHQSVFEFIDASGAPNLLLNALSDKLEYHDPWHLGRSYTHLFRGKAELEKTNAFLEQNGFDWLKFVDNGSISRKSDSIKVNEMHAYHLCLKGTSKSAAVRKDRELRGFHKNETIAIGDSAADFDLAKEVGAFFLLDNGIPESPPVKDFLEKNENAFSIDEKMNLGWSKVVSLFFEYAEPGDLQ